MQLPKFISKLFQTPTIKSSAPRPLLTELMPRDSIFFSFMHTPFNPDVLVGKKGGLIIYEKMRQDDTIKACLNLKKYAVLSSGWTIEPPKNPAKLETEALEFILYNLQHMEGTFDDDLLEIMTGFEYGFSVSEKIFQIMDSSTPYGGKIGVKSIKTRKPHWIDIKTDKFGNIEEDGIIQNRTSNYPKSKFILYTHDKTFDNPYGESDLRACYRAWWSKDIIIKFWNMWLERFGTPPVIGQITEALESGDEAALKEIFKNLTSKTSMLLPKGVEVNIPEIRGMGAQAYQKAIEAHDMAIARALLVPSLLGVSQQGNTGSYAQSRTHFNVFVWIIEKLRRTLEELINEQLIREVLDYNYHLENYPRFSFIPLNEDKKMELAKLYIDAISKGAITPTLQDENVFRNLLDLPEKTKEEVEKEPIKKEPLLEKEEISEKQFGGSGSGHHGHAGRPGEVGGSGAGGAGSLAEQMRQNVPGLNVNTYGVENYKGIKKLGFGEDKATATQNAEIIGEALNKVDQKHLEGLRAVYTTGGGEFLGSAVYLPPHKERKYAQEEIMLMQGWLDKTPHEKQLSLLHEIGHRVHTVTDKKAFVEFKKAGLGKYFKDLTDAKYVGNYKANQRDGEAFAESFARHAMGEKMSDALVKFWEERS